MQMGIAAKTEAVETSTVHLRSILHRSSQRAATLFEAAADEIRAKSDDAEVRFRALEWKSHAVPTVFSASFHPDPLVGFLDLWAYCIQLEQYTTNGDGSTLFGQHQSVAVDACRQIVEELRQTADLLRSDRNSTKLQRRLADWGKENPLRDPVYVRKSISTVLDSLIHDVDLGVGSVSGSIAGTMIDLNGRLSILVESIPKQARWQGEMLLESGTITEEEFRQLVTSLQKTMSTLDTVVTASPELVDHVLESVYVRMNDLLLSVDSMRVSTLYDLTRERLAVTAFIEDQRLAIQAELDAQIASGVTEFWRQGREMVDELFWKLAAFAGALCIAVFLFGMVVGRLAGRHGSAS